MSNSNFKHMCGTLALGTALSIGAASAQEAPTIANASIAFADHGGIYDWRADGDKGMWIQDLHHQWYYAKFMGSCTGLPFANGVTFATGPGGELDRWSYVRVRDSRRCYFQSFERSTGPVSKTKTNK